MVDLIPTPPSNCTLTRLGIDYLKLEALAGSLGQIGGFRIGDSAALIIDQDTTTNVAGNVVYNGSLSEMYFSKFSDHEVIIQCVVEHDKGDFDIGSIAILSNTFVPLIVARFEYIHSKIATTTTQAGGRWTFQLRFIQYQYENYWDFSGMTERYARFEAFTGNFADVPQRPIESPNSEQIQSDTVPAGDTNRRAYHMLPEVYDHLWVTNPFQMRLDDANFYRIDGGNDGDGHLYTFS